MNLKDELTSLYNSLLEKNEVEGLAFLAERFAGEIVFSTSFGLEDQVITHLILDNHIPISISPLIQGDFSMRPIRYGKVLMNAIIHILLRIILIPKLLRSM